MCGMVRILPDPPIGGVDKGERVGAVQVEVRAVETFAVLWFAAESDDAAGSF